MDSSKGYAKVSTSGEDTEPRDQLQIQTEVTSKHGTSKYKCMIIGYILCGFSNFMLLGFVIYLAVIGYENGFSAKPNGIPILKAPDLVKKGGIPKLIHQIYTKSAYEDLAEAYLNNSYQTKKMNPDFTYMYWNDANIVPFLKKHFPDRVIQAYNKIIPGAYQADLFRYAVLYIHGGIYIDIDMASAQPLNDLVNHANFTFAIPLDKEGCGLWNAVILSEPKQYVLNRTIEAIVNKVLNDDYGCGFLDITGPTVIGKVLRGLVNDSVQVLKHGLCELQNGERAFLFHHVKRGPTDHIGFHFTEERKADTGRFWEAPDYYRVAYLNKQVYRNQSANFKHPWRRKTPRPQFRWCC